MAKKANKAERTLIPAVSYLRKSTKGFKTEKDGTRTVRQERSIAQQREEIAKLAAREGYKIIREYADPGVSGTKANRPDFVRMLADVESKRDFVAILCDDVDRFSRQNWDDVQDVAFNLKKVGIKWIVTAAQGTYDLNENSTNLGQALKFVIDVWSSNQYSRKLGRRITLKNIDRAGKGIRSGAIPYATKKDGKGGLVHDDPKHVAVVKRIFKAFVVEGKPYNKIMAELNGDKIPSPSGRGKWSAVTVRDILTNAVYAGDFEYGRRQQGKFNVIGADGELDDAKNAQPKHITRDPIMVHRNVYEAMVDRKTFDTAQKRVAEVSERHQVGQRDKFKKYALSDILRCHHCGAKLSGLTHKGTQRRYYCGSTRLNGKGACPAGTPAISEELILPQVMRLFFETRDDITALLATPPKELVEPRQEDESNLQSQLDGVTAELKRTREKLIKIDWDAETAMTFQAHINELTARQREIETRLKQDQPPAHGLSDDDLRRLNEFWDEVDRSTISVPYPQGKIDPLLASFHRDPTTDDDHILLDPRVVNAALKALGTEIRLQFQTESVRTKRGPENRYTLTGGQYRLGQFKGRIAKPAGKGVQSLATDSM